MEIKILGCYGGQLPGKKLTSFLINGEVLIDAGAVVDSLEINEQNEIKHVVLSHSHIDHIRDVGMLADNVIGRKPFPVEVVAAEPTIDALKSHIMNNTIWPDFTTIPTPDAPVLKYVIAPENEKFSVGDLTFEFVRVNHPAPTTAMFITEGDSTLLFTADTGPTEDVWKKCADYKDTLKAVITEVSFPDSMAELSLLSGHLSPCHLLDELAKMDRDDLPVYLYHFKPAFEEQLQKEVAALGQSRIQQLEQDQVIVL